MPLDEWGARNPMFGKHQSTEAKRKISEWQKEHPIKYWLGKKKGPLSNETKRRISLSKKGKPRLNLRGSLHPCWKGGVAPEHRRIRNQVEYKLWRESVFTRDNYTCLWCGQRGGKLNADHIKPFAYFPELRFAIDNGQTLCISCHKKTDSWCNNKQSYRNSPRT